MRDLSPRYWLIACTILLAGHALVIHELVRVGDGKTHVYILDVDQGDSIFIVSPTGKQILVDGGPNLTALEHLGRLMPALDRSLDLVVLTHPDLDHLVAIPEVVERYRIGGIVLTGIAVSNPRYQRLLTEIEERHIPVLLADPRADIDLGDGVLLDTVWPEAGLLGRTVKAPNDTSVVMRLFTGSQSILLTGDIEKDAEEDILRSGVDIRSTILKVAHHGSKTSSSTGFLLAVNPDRAVISVGRDNSFGHPHPSVLERYRHFGIPVETTVEEGTIEIEMNPAGSPKTQSPNKAQKQNPNAQDSNYSHIWALGFVFWVFRMIYPSPSS
ncbi:MAG: MBL fold metallo-hydrolase [Candidatus Peregrinibacteria bacterium]|nr:MBL fold metallo-hydrolase [Candidatus Peregrinibacteria bacterium]